MTDRGLAFADNGTAIDRQTGPRTAGMRQPKVIAFGGHFNSGKSTLLNCLAGRAVLPTGDLPETGVPCCLYSATQDAGRLFTAEGAIQSLPCNTVSIAATTSIYGDDGCRRPEDHFPVRLELGLAGTAIPPGVVWIDSPGINDVGAMTDKAMAVAVAANALAWVLNSRQCLSQPEIDFLRRYAAIRGPQNLTLILNVFLEQGTTQAWTAFAMRELPGHLKHILSRAGEIGFNGMPRVLVVSAQAPQQDGDGSFGLKVLRSWSRETDRGDGSQLRIAGDVGLRQA